jgi:acyl-coenzyme A thioesterase PaaI-like protein
MPAVQQIDYRKALQDVYRDVVPMIGKMGVQVLDAGPGRVTLKLPWGVQNKNHIGTVYAGVLYSFLEVAGGAIIACSIDMTQRVPVIVESNIRFRRRVTTAIETTLELTDPEIASLNAELEADSKYRWTLGASAMDEEGEVVCDADLVYRFLRVGEPPPGA